MLLRTRSIYDRKQLIWERSGIYNWLKFQFIIWFATNMFNVLINNRCFTNLSPPFYPISPIGIFSFVWAEEITVFFSLFRFAILIRFKQLWMGWCGASNWANQNYLHLQQQQCYLQVSTVSTTNRRTTTTTTTDNKTFLTYLKLTNELFKLQIHETE